MNKNKEQGLSWAREMDDIADQLAVDSRKDPVSCVELKNRIYKALLSTRKEALEEAAKVCENSVQRQYDEEWKQELDICTKNPRQLAEEIRSLAQGEK
jgi:hypothetical protein